MTQAEMMLLEKGRVPARVVLSEIRVFMEKYGEDQEGGVVEGIAAKGGITPETVWTWLGPGNTRQSIDFDTADRILLYVRGPMWGHDEDLQPYYVGVNLNVAKCACPGCDVMIEVVYARPGGKGGVRRRYCSDTCRSVAYEIRVGKKTSRQKKHLTGMTKCRRGHKRTPENSKRRPDGRTECMECARINARDRRAARRAA